MIALGGALGPVVSRDSAVYKAAIRVLDACRVAIDSTGVTPNGTGILKADTLRFTGRGASGDPLSWAYRAVQVQQPNPCA